MEPVRETIRKRPPIAIQHSLSRSPDNSLTAQLAQPVSTSFKWPLSVLLLPCSQGRFALHLRPHSCNLASQRKPNVQSPHALQYNRSVSCGVFCALRALSSTQARLTYRPCTSARHHQRLSAGRVVQIELFASYLHLLQPTYSSTHT